MRVRTARESARNYFLPSGFQFISSVMGAAARSRSMLIRNAGQRAARRHEVDLDDAATSRVGETRPRWCSCRGSRFDSLAGADAVDEDMRLADAGGRFFEAGVHLLFIGDVHFAEQGAQAGGAVGDDGRNAGGEFHG